MIIQRPPYVPVLLDVEGMALIFRTSPLHPTLDPMKLETGLKATRTITLTPEHVETYARLTGDFNPLHFDRPFAERTKFGALIVQGGLTTGLIHAVVATDVPGPGSVFLSQDWKFTAPVFIGDTISAEVEIVHVHESKPVTQLKVQVRRQGGEVVLEGEAWCYTFETDQSEAVSR